MMSVALAVSGAVAQTASAPPQSGVDTDIALLRSDVQAAKTDVISHNMTFTDDQAKVFWPLYRDYAHQQQVIGDQRVAVIKEYADYYDGMTDAKADELMGRLLKFEQARTTLKTDYWPKFKAALGAKLAAKFYQVDNRLTQVIDLQISSEIPIIQ